MDFLILYLPYSRPERYFPEQYTAFTCWCKSREPSEAVAADNKYVTNQNMAIPQLPQGRLGQSSYRYPSNMWDGEVTEYTLIARISSNKCMEPPIKSLMVAFGVVAHFKTFLICSDFLPAPRADFDQETVPPAGGDMGASAH